MAALHAPFGEPLPCGRQDSVIADQWKKFGQMRAEEARPGWIFVDCPICGSSEQVLVLTHKNRLFGTEAETALRRCVGCDLHITNPQPRGQALSAFYGTQAYYTHKSYGEPMERLRQLRIRLQVSGPLARMRYFLEQHTNRKRLTMRWCPENFSWVKGATLLDYGCGSGKSTKMASDLGLRAVGIEPDSVARDVAASLGVRVYRDLDEMDQEAKRLGDESPVRFERIVLSHVLEHVPAPLELMANIRQRLMPAGRALVSVPNVESYQAQVFGGYWIGYDMPRHLWHFSLSTLSRLVEMVGLEIVERRTIELSGFAAESQGNLMKVEGRELSYNPRRECPVRC